MLTPVEVQSKTFKSGLGYDKKDVESFRAEVLRSYEELYRTNMELKDKVNVLSEGIQYYKSIEKTLQKALVLAEKTAEETKNNAALEAKRIEKEAQAKASILVADAKNELNNLHQQTVALVQQYEKYRLQFKNLAQAQMELISSDAFSLNIEKIEAFNDTVADFVAQKPEQKTEQKVEQKAEQKPVQKTATPFTNTKEKKAVKDIKDNNIADVIELSNSEDAEEQDFDDDDFDSAEQNDFDFMNLDDSDSDI